MRRIRALSIRQPWAQLVMCGEKTVENRTWETKYRGILAIHASSKIDHEAVEWLTEVGYMFPELPTGAVLGVVNLVSIDRPFFQDFRQPPSAANWRDYEQYGWNFARPFAFLEPFAYQGQLGLFHVKVPGTQAGRYVNDLSGTVLSLSKC